MFVDSTALLDFGYSDVNTSFSASRFERNRVCISKTSPILE